MDYSQKKCIDQLFEERVVKTPDNIALVLESQTITYRQLNHKANKIAHYLRQQGVEKETLVGIYTDGSSFEMIIAILAILKAGAAYVPIDSQYPRARINFILEDADINILLTTQSGVDTSIIEKPLTIICLDDNPEIIQCNQDNLDVSINGDNLAYLIYTSGSTGKPKGVLIPHRGVVRLVKETNYVNITSEDVFLQTASVSFDAATFEIWGSLLNGGKLVLLPTTKPSIAEIARVIQSEKISIAWFTAGLFNLIIDQDVNALSRLKTLLVGGEALSVNHIRRGLINMPNTKIINGYGPTENTTFTCTYDIPRILDFSLSSIPIGKAINQTQVYILNEQLESVTVGVVGELYTGGEGLARGYLNRPELTTQKFITNPYGEGRLYKTGDLVKYLADGNIEFIGRVDNQVKVRGFRIELEEVERTIQQHPQIEDAVVICREDNQGESYLASYLVRKNDSVLEIQQLRQDLAQKLPQYMVPTGFVFLDSFPLTTNAKVDKKALKEIEITFERTKELVLPQTETQTKLLAIWRQVLGIDEISVEDDFFILGGHSLKAAQILSRIRDEWGVDLPISIVFNYKEAVVSAISIARLIDQKISTTEISKIGNTIKANQSNDLPLSIYQQRIWLLAKQADQHPIHNLPRAFRVVGNLNVEFLAVALKQIVERHSSLRTIFPIVNQLPVQRILPTVKLTLSTQVVDLNEETRRKLPTLDKQEETTQGRKLLNFNQEDEDGTQGRKLPALDKQEEASQGRKLLNFNQEDEISKKKQVKEENYLISIKKMKMVLKEENYLL